MPSTLAIEQKNYSRSLSSKTSLPCCTEYCQGSTLEVSFGKVKEIIEQNVEDPLEPTDEELRGIKSKYQSEVLGRIYEVYIWGETMKDRYPEYWQRLSRLREQGLTNWDNRFLISLSAVPMQSMEDCLEALEIKLSKLKEITIEKLRLVVAKFHDKEQTRIALSQKTTEKDITFVEQKFTLSEEQKNYFKGVYEAGGLTNRQVIAQLEKWGFDVTQVLTQGEQLIRRLETEEKAKEQIQRNYQQLSLKVTEKEQKLQETQQQLEETLRINQEKEEESARLKRELEEAQKAIAVLKEQQRQDITESENQENNIERSEENNTEINRPIIATESSDEDNIEITLGEIATEVSEETLSQEINSEIINAESPPESLQTESGSSSSRKTLPFEPRKKKSSNKRKGGSSKGKSKGKSAHKPSQFPSGFPSGNRGSKPPNRATSSGFGKR